jgi:hypothetical protein
MSGQINRISRLRLQFFQKSGRLVLLLLFVLDYNTSQKQTSTPAQNINVLRSCCIAAANILGEYQPSFSSKSEVMVNYPSSLLSGDGGVLSLAVDARVFASLSRAVGGMMNRRK